MMVIDHSGSITWASDRSLVGTSIFDHAHPDDDIRPLLSGRKTRHRWRGPDGDYRVMETVGRDLHAEPTVLGVLLQARDITEAAQLEAMMTESTDAAYELAAMRDQLVQQLQELDRSKQQLSQALVHDLKSPLTVILMTAKFIIEDLQNPEELEAHSSTIHRAAEAMHRMVLDLLDIGRSEDGQLVATQAALDGKAFVLDIVERTKTLLDQRWQVLEWVAVPVRGDQELLGRVLQNLLDNCAKYAPQKSTINVELAAHDDTYELVVSDRGAGIPDEFKTKIFDLYTRLDRDARKNARTSRGVGLAFCKLAMAAHGGSIVVEDRDGGGSVFRCRWPKAA
ncbi:MAG: PAS domain-containing sensor histidine kinase [Kofleriaceae bacterium]